MKIIILLAFIGIFISLGSALVFMMRDKSGTNRMVNALTWRIGLSVLLFLFILFSWWMGWIEPTGISFPRR
ncbi:MAG: twin transmembrane helix small protein [Burkholderiaceae bacterium]|nr:MAG: twin transmembrane helix small protein [Burkholderiaceae bacterium]